MIQPPDGPPTLTRIQIRAAARLGRVYRDDRGLAGDDVNLPFRVPAARPMPAAPASPAPGLAGAISPCTPRQETSPPQGRTPAFAEARGTSGEACRFLPASQAR